MKFEVTRDVVSDLWPLCRSGDATADSRALVDAYLAEDGSFVSTLQEGERLTGAMPALRLSPDAERRLLDDARGRARMKLLVVGGAIALVGFLALVALGGALLLAARGF
jgi:ferric-dicitrate binding protein FerR (iron transport regulator)